MKGFQDIMREPREGGMVRGARYDNNVLKPLPDGRISQKRWYAYGEQMVVNMMGRTGLTFSIRDFRRHLPTVERDEQKVLEPEVTIACVSSSFFIQDPKHADDGPPVRYDLRIADYRDGCRLCEAVDEQVGERWVRSRLEELAAALEYNPHIICFGELAYPPASPAADKGWSAELLQRFAELRSRFENQAIAMLENRPYQPFLFLGSYHCLMTLYAIGVIYPWGNLLDGAKANIRTEPWDDSRAPEVVQIDPELPVLYKKRFPARRVGESTRVPSSLNFDVFHTDIGNIATLICSDVLDLNQFMNVARHNLLPSREQIDFVLVPSFNESRKLASMCCELSYAASCGVIMVNANAPRATYPKTAMYACGLPFDELQKVKGLGLPVALERKDIELQRSHDGPSMITLFKLNWAGLRGLRNDLVTYWEKPKKLIGIAGGKI